MCDFPTYVKSDQEFSSSEKSSPDDTQKKVEEQPEHPPTGCMEYHKGAREYFSEYCNNTSLHGLKYVGGEKRTRYEKGLWLILFLTAVTGCSILIKKTYDKWESSPVIVSFDHNPVPVWEIPFPAITICSQNKVKQTVQNFTEYLHKFFHDNITEDELETFGRLVLVCDQMQIDSMLFKTEYENATIFNFLMEVAPTIREIFFRCKWNNIDIQCDKLFAPTLNEDGMCFTYNMLGDNELFTDQAYRYGVFNRNVSMAGNWNLEDGYGNTELEDSYPFRVARAGIKVGLELTLVADENDLDYVCTSPVQGYKVILHQAGDISRGKTHYIRIPLDEEVTVALQPHLMTTADNLRNYLPETRKCYFDNEYKLQFFQRYSQANCELECLSDAMIKRCGCVAYYMPRNESTPICGSRHINCALEAETSLLKMQQSGGKRESACVCLPSCFSLSYGAETSQSTFKIANFLDSVRHATGLKLENETRIHLSIVKIFFKETQFIATERSELYGITDFLSNCGGIFGLFTGFSILSLIEVIYFLTCRAWINKHRFGRYFMETSENPERFRRNITTF